MTGIFRGDSSSGTGVPMPDVLTRVAKAGDTMTGHLIVPAGATGTQVPQRGEVDSALALKANLASPALTGIPTAERMVVGDQGTEGTGINVGGITYESTLKVSDIDGTNYAQNIIHRHSTTLEPLILSARSNSNTTAHADVTAGQNCFSVYASGWAGSNYKLFGSMSFGADSTGTISNTSAPGKFSIAVTPNGSVTPITALSIDNAGITTASIKNIPAGNIVAITQQAAINELDTDKAAVDQVHYVGTTSIAANRASAAQALTGITSIDGTANALANTAGEKLPTIGCTQGSGALTFTAASMYLDFRSATLTSGTPTTVLAAPSNLVLPSGGTLGFTTTIQGRIYVAEVYDGSVAHLAICSASGGLQTDETNLISTTAIDTAADSASVWYSNSALSSKPYRIIGAVDVVNTAGAWGDTILVQGAGGQALTAMSSLGYGQTWVSNGSGITRVLGTTYYSGSKPIQVAAYVTGGGAATYIMQCNVGTTVFTFVSYAAAGGTFDVPPYTPYSIASAVALGSWAELR